MGRAGNAFDGGSKFDVRLCVCPQILTKNDNFFCFLLFSFVFFMFSFVFFMFSFVFFMCVFNLCVWPKKRKEKKKRREKKKPGWNYDSAGPPEL